jgi:eukaryotic-like serine/threonine-protein kinase
MEPERYAIDRELGHGGMATVYLARDLKHDRLVAMKVLHPELAAAVGPERFLREIRLTAQLQHPHILTLLDSGERDGSLYYVMPYVEGESLRQRLQRTGPLAIDEALRIAGAIAGALDYAHERGVIHRDVKPENIMLHQGEPMLSDFGIAIAVAAARGERLTETGFSLGTPAYMSPEQSSAEPRLDGRSDQYSLACVVYEMLAGEPPYTGPTAQAIIAKRFMEPIPRLGTVRSVPPALEAAITKALSKTPADRFVTATAFATALTAAPKRARLLRFRIEGVGLIALVLLVGAAAWWYAFQRRGTETASGSSQVNIVPFTSSAGTKYEPVFSPDGKQIAYGWTPEASRNQDIYVQLVGAGAPLRLTSSPADEYCPAWSPDGRFIAFVRDLPGGHAAYYVIPSLGGAERKIADRYAVQLQPPAGRCMDWSGDGRRLITADAMTPGDSRLSIIEIAIADGQRTPLLSQPDQYVAAPARSPDGRWLAYLQGPGFLTTDIYVIPLAGGPPRRLTSDGHFLLGFAWTADGAGIVFSSNRNGFSRLWRVALSGGAPELVNAVGEESILPSIAATGNRLAYVELRVDANIWRAPGPVWKGPRPAPQRVIASSRGDYNASFSADGRRIAFSSDRTGAMEIWIASAEGTGETQLTTLHATDAGSPTWSPDGVTIAFDARVAGHGDIFVIGADGGAPRRLTTDPAESNLPTWSADGRWIYYSSRRTGTWQIWKVPVAGGASIQLTTDGGFIAHESADGKWLYVWSKDGGGTISRVPVTGGASVRVFQGVPLYSAWTLVRDGIYFVDPSGSASSVRFYDFATQATRVIGPLDIGQLVPGGGYFDVSRDGRWILYDRGDQVESDIMLVENFR